MLSTVSFQPRVVKGKEAVWLSVEVPWHPAIEQERSRTENRVIKFEPVCFIATS
jgi:hypothetical protein